MPQPLPGSRGGRLLDGANDVLEPKTKLTQLTPRLLEHPLTLADEITRRDDGSIGVDRQQLRQTHLMGRATRDNLHFEHGVRSHQRINHHR